jgi:phosphohistidine phosphatase
MKTIYLMRHAKSKRGLEYATDYERPLAKRGKQNAAQMGQFLVERDSLPDLILSSSAERARDTTVRLIDAADYQGAVRFTEALYDTEDETYLDMVWDLDDSISSVMFVGHNPTTASVIESLCGAWLRMPTAAIARVDFPVDSWRDVDERGGRLVWVQVPREL